MSYIIFKTEDLCKVGISKYKEYLKTLSTEELLKEFDSYVNLPDAIGKVFYPIRADYGVSINFNQVLLEIRRRSES